VWVSAGDLTLPGLTLLPGACGGSILHWSGMVLTASLTCESTGFLLVLNALQTSAAGPPTYIAQASWVSPVVAPAGCSPLSIDSGVITCVFNPLSSICGSPNDCGNANCSDSDVCHLVGSTLHLVIS
jgi:hypothetical protein